jgi:hypothetical protein
MYSGEKVTKELDTILLATRCGAAWREKKEQNLLRPHLATRPAPTCERG